LIVDTPAVGQAESSTVRVWFRVELDEVVEELLVVCVELGVLVEEELSEVVVVKLITVEVLELRELGVVCDELDVVLEEILDCASFTAATAPIITTMIMITATKTL
jgi:hypothetical protein